AHRDAGHHLDAGRDHEIELPRPDRGRRVEVGLHGRAALSIDGRSRHGLRPAGNQGDHPSQVPALLPDLRDTAELDVLDLTRIQIVARYEVAAANEKRLLVGGEWIDTGDWLEVRSPYSGDGVGRVAKAGADETRRALDAAERAMQNPLPAHKRAEILVRVAAGLGRRHEEVAR